MRQLIIMAIIVLLLSCIGGKALLEAIAPPVGAREPITFRPISVGQRNAQAAIDANYKAALHNWKVNLATSTPKSYQPSEMARKASAAYDSGRGYSIPCNPEGKRLYNSLGSVYPCSGMYGVYKMPLAARIVEPDAQHWVMGE